MTGKRIFDFMMAAVLLSILCFPILIIALAVKFSSRGSILYWSERIGINNTIFRMPKFRTMRVDTPVVATHLLEKPESYMTPIGPWLRKFSLDELPQLWSILKGDMSFVGPRPALYNQDDLIALRTTKGIHRIIPGITGWAQINGRDEITVPQKVAYDEYYFRKRSCFLDLKILYVTALKVIKTEGIQH